MSDYSAPSYDTLSIFSTALREIKHGLPKTLTNRLFYIDPTHPTGLLGVTPTIMEPLAGIVSRSPRAVQTRALHSAVIVSREPSSHTPRILISSRPSSSSVLSRRHLSTSLPSLASGHNLLGSMGSNNASTPPSSYFQRPSLPANTIIRFVPQQTAWIVERMGKYNRVLEPGFALLIPFLDRIAYVKSLKEAAIEIPSQSAITADNVTLELDGVLYTRVIDPYKAR